MVDQVKAFFCCCCFLFLSPWFRIGKQYVYSINIHIDVLSCCFYKYIYICWTLNNWILLILEIHTGPWTGTMDENFAKHIHIQQIINMKSLSLKPFGHEQKQRMPEWESNEKKNENNISFDVDWNTDDNLPVNVFPTMYLLYWR